MESKALIGIITLLFTYALFSWALGRYINRRKEKKATEFQNFLSGAWILGLLIIFMIIYLYIGK